MSTEVRQVETSYPPEESFFDANRGELRVIFDILEISEQWSNELEDIVNVTQPWVKGDHSRPLHQFHLNDNQKKQLTALYPALGLVQERTLPEGHYDQMVVLGSVHSGNVRRLDFLEQSLSRSDVQTDRIVLLGGQRSIYEERERDDIDETLQELSVNGHHDPWLDRVATDGTALQWESDLVRLAGIARLGKLSLKQLHLRLGNADPLKSYEFDWQGVVVSLLHTLAVERNGEPRHNTEACVRDWLRTYHPPVGAKVGFVAANPHIDRVTRSAQAVLNNEGRQDIQLIPGGPGISEKAGHSIVLGEVARLLYEDLRTVKASA